MFIIHETFILYQEIHSKLNINMNCTKCIRVHIKNSYDITFSHPAPLHWNVVKSRWSNQYCNAGRALQEKGQVHRMRSSTEVNPGIQHIPAELLQKSQPAIFSFYILLEFVSTRAPFQQSSVSPIHRQSMQRATSSSPTQPQLLLPLFQPPILPARWQTTIRRLPTHVPSDLLHADPTYHLHNHSSLFQWLEVWKNSNEQSSRTKASLSVVEVEWALYRDSCSLLCNMSLLQRPL